ncbi:CLUMA_CG002685, isoform A [Clunio marinus]|uniref:CLUMA_CG002685, isoform A n=1 Tax=Clunio marinus TaxID=568069 RepID=A0A1J1HLN2_9DIPT|nr:CLUMA_CG002685, isoform A [Clunio marinus]
MLKSNWSLCLQFCQRFHKYCNNFLHQMFQIHRALS